MKILIINPGSTSTKVGIWIRGEGLILEKTISHPTRELANYESIVSQKEYRLQAIENLLEAEGQKLEGFKAIAARGGILKPLASGTYEVNGEMLLDLEEEKYGRHASNLGAFLAAHFACKLELVAYITDPVSVDEFTPLARYSGIREIERRSQLHALNIKAVALKMADKLNRKLEDLNLILVHLGGGISIAALAGGKIIDVNNANEMGPYSPERTGTLPVGDLVEMAFSGKYSRNELKNKLVRYGGLNAYLKTNDCLEVEERIEEGDSYAQLVYEGMIYQISKRIGAKAAVLKGKVDLIVLTGGLARSSYVTEKIKERTSFLAPLEIYPSVQEMVALAQGAYRVLSGQEEVKIYKR